MQPLVSVLIPSYNAEAWLAETLESALDQTWSPLEVIVVDDGSTDRSLDIARSLEPRGVRVLTQPNEGAAVARNRALGASRGAFIQYLDADDLLSPDKIEAQVRCLAAAPAGVIAVSATMHFFDGNDPTAGMLEDGWPMVDADDPVEWLVRLLGGDGRGSMVHPGAWLLPRCVSDAAGPWDPRAGIDDDGEYFFRAVLSSRGIRRSSSGRSYYRKFKSGRSLSGANTPAAHAGALYALDRRAERLLAVCDTDRARRGLATAYLDRANLAYAIASEVANAAVARARALGVLDPPPIGGGWRIRMLNRLLGWRVARRLSRLYRRMLSGLGA